jgi:two-component system, chemotaxis family, sensor kinase CheA
MTEDDKALLADFLLEAREIMDKLDHDFVQLEMSPDDDKLLGNIFRGMHTLKGSSGFFAFTRLERLSHAGEALLSKLRDKSLRLTQDMVTALLRMLDAVRQIIDAIQLSDVEPTACDDALLSDLKALASGAPSLPAAATSPIESTPPSAVDIEPLPDSAVGTDAAAPVKVSIELLDTLMNLVSEMVLARNRLLACAPLITDSKFTEVVRNVDLITLELQERMMATRMSPVRFGISFRVSSEICHRPPTNKSSSARLALTQSLIAPCLKPLETHSSTSSETALITESRMKPTERNRANHPWVS